MLRYVMVMITLLASVHEAVARPQMQEVGFDALPAWSTAQAASGLAAWKHSCSRYTPRGAGIYGIKIPLQAWRRVCDRATHTPPAQAQRFFEEEFTPYALSLPHTDEGLITGYYTPHVDASHMRSVAYPYPIYRKPPTDALRTAYSRAQINDGALAGKGLELLWVADEIDAFFLHIQGSGYARFADGHLSKLVFAGKNQHPYTAIGRQFVEEGAVAAKDMSMQWLKAWLRAHPHEARAVMERNSSYIFFEEASAADGVRGAAGTPLTPYHSVAIDPSYMDYGIPLYVDAQSMPDGGAHQALVITQDTGSAIKGALRLDYYLGSTDAAESLAGMLKSPIRLFALLPRV
jgi:membrane-bound lytic murein transglycosylase A